ncbi:hypothetical protein HanRHA438_Chr09g0380271 [Helianthus annuus]|nr:hypothetical protein HanRHA438_Chr09g0380271 [Helianthus annuus]
MFLYLIPCKHFSTLTLLYLIPDLRSEIKKNLFLIKILHNQPPKLQMLRTKRCSK